MRLRILALFVTLTATVACTGDDGISTEARATPAWELGDAGSRYGPFPFPGGLGGAAGDRWFTVVVAAPDPIVAFETLIADAESAGFDVSAANDDACWQTWGREAVPLGDDEEFGGKRPLGDDLPAGAERTGIGCAAVGVRDDERILMQLDAPAADATWVRRPVIVVESTDRRGTETTADLSDVPDLPAIDAAPVTPVELRGAGLDESGPLSPTTAALVRPYPGDPPCVAVLFRLSRNPIDAASAVLDMSPLAEFVDGKPSAVDTSAGEAAVFQQNVGAGAGVLLVLASGTASGSDVLKCQYQG